MTARGQTSVLLLHKRRKNDFVMALYRVYGRLKFAVVTIPSSFPSFSEVNSWKFKLREDFSRGFWYRPPRLSRWTKTNDIPLHNECIKGGEDTILKRRVFRVLDWIEPRDEGIGICMWNTSPMLLHLLRRISTNSSANFIWPLERASTCDWMYPSQRREVEEQSIPWKSEII